MLKRKVALAASICITALLAGCSLDPLSGRLTTPPPDAATYQPVSPNAEAAVSDTYNVTLYFGFQDSGMLSTQSREVELRPDERVEKRVLEELISGPDAGYSYLTALMPTGVRVMDVEDRGGVLMVTLSGEFLSAPADAPDGWEGDAYWSAEVPRRRLLALQSIVCAMTDLGEYDSVQLLIDRDGDGERSGERVPRYYFYADAARSASVLMEAVRRDESVVLTPRNTVSKALGFMQSKDWDALYRLIAPVDMTGERPAQDAFMTDMRARAYTLTGFEVGDAMVSGDGSAATVCVNAQFAFRDENAREVSAFPLRMVRDQEAWKLTYASLKGLLEGF